jgi:heme exporter protein C
MTTTGPEATIRFEAARGTLAAALAAAVWMAFCFAPTERTMGDAQRIVYVHVPVAWLGLLGMVATAGCGAAYLRRRNLHWDAWAQSAAEVGWVCCTLTLITGSLWARSAWGTWWEWDPRLTTAFILWMIYSGVLFARSSVDDPHRRARLGAVLTILGSLDIPMVVMATRWFRGLHPVKPEMIASMRITLLAGVVCWTALFVWLTLLRRRQIEMEQFAHRSRTVLDTAY